MHQRASVILFPSNFFFCCNISRVLFSRNFSFTKENVFSCHDATSIRKPKKHKISLPFQALASQARIRKLSCRISNGECNSRFCRFMSSLSSAWLRSLNVLNGDENNNQQETQPLLHNHEHHRISNCSCLPKLFFNCCFLVSWTLLFLTFNSVSYTKKMKRTKNRTWSCLGFALKRH